MRILILFIFIFISPASFSQIAIPKNDFTSLGDIDVAYSKIKNFNALPSGQKKVDDLSYSDVQGSPFWDNNWNAAVFTLANGGMAKTEKAKLNLFTNEVHFLNDNIELAGDNSQIKKIYFFKETDLSKPVAVFESLVDAPNNTNAYYRVLNEGNFRLLKLSRVLVKENDYNPALGKKEYAFYSKITYAISDKEKIIPIKSLSQASIFSAIPESIEYLDWLRQNNNKLKNELDIIFFFHYLDNRIKK